jgi:cytochrome c-type biogenesis protein CcmF
MSIAPNTRWIKDKFKYFKTSISIFILAIFINFFITYFFKSYSLLSNLIIISSIFLIIHTLIDFKKAIKKNFYLNFSRIISHLGFGFLVFFIGINHNFSLEKDFNLKVGENKKFENFEVNFKSIEMIEKKNYKAIIGTFNILSLKNLSSELLKPEIRIYTHPKTLTYEASIRTELSHDTYLTMSNIDESDFYNIKYQKKPFMIWIWISAVMISIGGFARIFKNEK